MMMPWALLLVASLLQAAPPQILKVDPPNWWAGDSVNPVRLLIRGVNLTGIRAESALPVGRVTWNRAGTYAFIDISIPPATRTGSYPLKLTNSDGASTFPFEIAPRLDPKERFQGFSTDDVIYLIMPDRFANGDPLNDGSVDRPNLQKYHGGDLQGIIDRLPYLRDLGITAIWINAVYDNAGNDYHGYGAIDFYAVDEHLGTLATFRTLVDAAHRNGIRVIQDQVVNHTGPLHPWVADPPTATWFNGTQANHLRNDFRIWTTIDPYGSPDMQRRTIQGWFANILPDLNQDDAEVRRYLIENTLWWLGMTGLDGIRQDTLPYVPRRFWSEWMAAVRREYPRLRVVGQVLNGDPVLVASFQTDVDTLFDFPLYYAIRDVFAGARSMSELPAVLAHDWLYRSPERLVTLLGLHDVTRFMSTPGATAEGLRLAFTFLLTTRGTPLIYYGDEIGTRRGRSGQPERFSSRLAGRQPERVRAQWQNTGGERTVRTRSTTASSPRTRHGSATRYVAEPVGDRQSVRLRARTDDHCAKCRPQSREPSV